jgi:hypothetical protein
VGSKAKVRGSPYTRVGGAKIRKPWALKAALLLSFLLLLVALGVGFWVYSLRDRKWAALLARVDELSAEIEPPRFERLPLGRPMLPGNAWDDYLQAFPPRTGAPPDNFSFIVPFLHRKQEANRAKVEELVSRYSASIDLLSSGVRRQEARIPRTQLPPNYLQGISDYDARNLNTLGIAKARLLADAGKMPEALDLLIDVCAHGRDIAQLGFGSETSAGIALMQSAFRELRDILQSRDVTKEDLLLLDHRLQGVDDHFPGPGRDLENDLKGLGILFIDEDLDDTAHHTINGKRERRSWRFLYSSRLQAATGFSVADRLVRQILEAGNQPWSVQYAAIEAASRELSESKDEILSVRFQLHRAIWDHQARAALRLLRVAAHYRATGDILELADPFGGTLRTLDSEGSLTGWHRSPYGEVDRTPKKGSGDYWRADTIEVRRR